MARNRMLSELAVGTKVTAEDNDVRQNFIVVHQGRPSSIYSTSFDNSTILMLEDLCEIRQWHSSDLNDYAASTIHTYLNGFFFNLCTSVIRDNAKPVKIPYRAGAGHNSTVASGESGLTAKIWLPSGPEVGLTKSSNPGVPADGAKFSYFLSGLEMAAATMRIAYLNGAATEWDLRSPYCSASIGPTDVCGVNTVGDIARRKCSNVCGIRPTLALPSTLFVDESGGLTESNGTSGTYVKKAGIWVPVF